MKKFNFYQKASLLVVSLFAATLLGGSAASAIAYNGDQTVASPIPAYNVFTGVPTTGNEADFLRARVPVNGADSDATTQYADPLDASCTDGQKIQMRVYVHNGASADANNNGSGPSVIHGAKVKVSVPTTEATTFTPTATLSATNAATVNDGTVINCGGKKVKLHYIAGSASQFSNGSGVVALSDDIVGSGVSIRSQHTDGDVWGCWNERVYVVLSVKVEVVPTPPPVVATCDLFKLDTADERTVKVSQFKYTASNATFKSVVLNWDAGKTNVSSSAITDASKVVGQSHQYAADGTYKVTATVSFSSSTNGNIVAGTENCTQQVTFTTTQPPVITTPPTEVPPVTPPAPTVLPNTGAGSVAALFTAVMAASAVAYRWFVTRRLSA